MGQHYTLSDIQDRAADDAAKWAEQLLGKPTQRTGSGLRWGGSGGLSLTTRGAYRGRWKDFRSGDSGDIIDLVAREMYGGNIGEAAKYLRHEYGLEEPSAALSLDDRRRLNDEQEERRKARQIQHAKDKAALDAEAIQGGQRAANYVASLPHAADTWVETYLREDRGFRGALPPETLCDVNARHPDTNKRFPAMVHPIRSVLTGSIIAAHVTYLHPNEPRRLTEKMGEPRGRHFIGKTTQHPDGQGAVMLTPFDEVTTGLHIAEGVENTLALYSDEIRPAWAMLNAGLMKSFPVLSGIECLTIYADRDEAGRSAGKECRKRWKEAGCEVELFIPNKENCDWDDILQENAA